MGPFYAISGIPISYERQEGIMTLARNAIKLYSLKKTPQNIASVILDNRVILSKAAVIVASVIAIYYHDLNLIFTNAVQFTTGNISNYVITIPFLSGYIIY